MKKTQWLLAPIFVICMIGCIDEQDLEPKEYPYVIIKDLTPTVDGAIMTAEVKDLGSSPITSYGFVWHSNYFEPLDSWYRTTIDDESLKVGEIFIEVQFDFESGKSYIVRPFIENTTTTTYGTRIDFNP